MAGLFYHPLNTRQYTASLFLFAVAVSSGSHVDLFKRHLSCPFASLWLEHGAERAIQLLSDSHDPMPVQDGPVGLCAIGPGPVGGAHMHGFSPGYSNNCSGTPAQASPYMYPMAWKATTLTQSIPNGSNTVNSTEHGMEMFRFDLNWHRTDTFLGPLTITSLHRGGKLVFLTRIGDKITNCSYTNLSMVGVNRPDWFLDDRGGGIIDEQYLGKEQVYYMGQPRLVRKWRKNGIANQVFTVSVDEYNETHYPLIINIPGEGGVMDKLKMWSDHEPLDKDDLAPFLLDETYEGECPYAPAVRPGSTHDVPSALGEDPNGFRTVIWTGSPYASNSTPPPPPPSPTPVKPGSYQCSVCEHVYDADRDGNGVPFEKLPDTWTCPVCGASKSEYKEVISYQCSVCEHVYDADRDGNGVAFEQLPDSWKCPVCGAPKSAYKKVGGLWAHVEPLME